MCFFHKRVHLEALEKKKINLAPFPVLHEDTIYFGVQEKRSYLKTANYLICPTMLGSN